MDYAYDLRLAGILIRILAARELQFPACYVPFTAEASGEGQPDWTVEVYFGKDEFSPAEGDRVTRFLRPSRDDFLRVIPGDKDRVCRFFVPREIEDSFCRYGNWTLFLVPEQLLLPYDRVILHASIVVDNGGAVLFTAPSGGGKSTQANIWASTFGAEILNGDKAIIEVGATPPCVYGSPVAGSSRIYKNEKAPIRAIVYLKKGDHNEVVQLDGRRAFMTLYSQMVKSRDDAAFNETLVALVAKIVEKLPILELTCIPEPSAARELRAWLATHLPDWR